MALATYTDLQASIASWNFQRTTLPTADFIALAEAEMRAETALKARIEETDVSLSSVTSSRFIALPAGFQEALTLWREPDTGREELSRVEASQMTTMPDAAIPQLWCVDGANIAFERPADDVYPFTLRCFSLLPSLSAGNPTNWLLTNYPNVYLAACNVQAALYLADEARAGTWAQAYQNALLKAATAEARARGSSPLRVDSALMRRHGFNIYTGL